MENQSNVAAELLPLPDTVPAGRIPPWHLDRLVHRACPVCDEDSPLPLCRRPDKLQAGRCPECGMIYLPDVPCEEDLAELYSGYGEYKGMTAKKSSWWPTRSLWWANANIMILENSGGLRNQRLCEVGCAFGAFLQLARRRRAAVSGVELDEEAVEHLKGLGIWATRSLDTAQDTDIICAFQLLEHLADPGELLGQIASALVDDGRLLLAMPNGREVEKVGPQWLGFRIDLEHVNYFSVQTLNRLLMRHGLYMENYWEHLQPWLQRTVADPKKRPKGGLLRTARNYLLGKLFNQPFYVEGQYVLTVLARKAAAP